MTNKLSQLFIKEFITSDIPDDVISVEILYKESNSANVYVVDSLKKTDEFINEEPYNNISNAWTYANTDEVFSFYDLNRLGRYEVKSESNEYLKELTENVRARGTVYRDPTGGFR